MKFFDKNWQDRWLGLADGLERAMENQFYRVVLCLATIALILAYVIVATKLAQPEIFRTSSLIEVTLEETDRPLEFLEIAVVNRAIENIEKMHSALSIYRKFQPTPIRQDLGYFVSKSAIREWQIEAHVLRLWMDELRGQPALGAFDLASESVVRLVMWELFPDSMIDLAPPPKGSTWFENVNCHIPIGAALAGQECAGTRASPMSLVGWMALQLHASLRDKSVHWRLGKLAELMRAATDPEMMSFDRAAAWPLEGSLFGKNLGKIHSHFGRILSIATSRSSQSTFSEAATLGFKRFQLFEIQDPQIKVGLAVVGSCLFPQIEQLQKFEARELVWFQDCDEKTIVHPASDARSFAKRNPDLVMAKVGIQEIRLAVKRGWISSKALITDLQSQLVSTGTDGDTASSSSKLPPMLRTQKTEWLADAGVLLLKAPVEALPFVRFDDGAAHTL